MNLDFLPITTKKQAKHEACVKGAVSFTVGVAAGAVIGAALGLLFAPQTGEETRAQIKDKTVEVAGTVKEKAIVVKDKAAELAGTVKDKVESLKTAKCEEIAETAQTEEAAE